MGAGIRQGFLQHFRSIATGCEFKIAEEIPVVYHHNFHRAAIQVVKILFQPFHIIRHHHCREVIANDHIAVVLRCRMASDVCSSKEILKPVGQRAVIIMCQGGYQQTFPETAGTQEHGGFIGLETWNVIRLIHIIKTTVTHFGIIGHGIGNRYTCLNFHILSLFVTLTVTKLQKFFVLRVESGQNMK